MSSKESNASDVNVSANSNNDLQASNNDVDTCVVCFKNVEIYSIGECDHPVCYECSTRMRVLCQQNECPICRQVLGKVIFTYDKLPYRELEAKNRSEYYSKRYKISFYTNDIQKHFFQLLDHPCPICNVLPYRSFQGLKDHVKREHKLQYCEICVDNLKIFTFERRCYTQAELNLHRTKGDVDNKSHRGHPLCEYCNKRYLDRDELFRHLRREHYYCHFCDADGYNEFYKDYAALAEHFRQDHYLCEEGDCATQEFIGAFRSEIDYKAHVASVHGKSMNKQQAKQTRTLQLEITLGPRGRGGQGEQNVANMRARGSHEIDDDVEPSSSYVNSHNQRPLTIDSQNEQDFPSLSGGQNSALPPLMPFPMRRGIAAGIARTKENFPALGGSSSGGVPQRQTPNQQQGPPISSMLKKPNNTNTSSRTSQATALTSANSNNPNGSSMVIHVSNRSTNGAISKKPNASGMDFPALPASSSKAKKQMQMPSQPQMHHQKQPQQQQHHQQHQQQSQQQPHHHQQQPHRQQQKPLRHLEEDMIESSNSNVSVDNVAAKHRNLMDDYVSVADPKNFQKLQMLKQQQEENEQQQRKKNAERNKSAPKLNSEEFPTLGGGSTNGPSSNNWRNPINEKKQRELENRKAKVAPAPLLPTSKENKTNPSRGTTNATTTSTSNGNNKEKKNKEKKSDDGGHEVQQNPGKGHNKTKEKNNNNSQHNKNENKKMNSTAANSNAASDNNDNQSHQSSKPRPPPGFAKSAEASTSKNLVQQQQQTPPPGFLSNVTVNSVAKSPNNLTFTTSMGESFSIMPKHSYTSPPDSLARNQKLVEDFQIAMNGYENFAQFHVISQKFREGFYKPEAYYEHCQCALGDKFDSLFPELLALLPDISKQQALYLVHVQRLNSVPPAERKKLPQLDVCSICKQVMFKKEINLHQQVHEFPTLQGDSNVTPSKVANASGRRK